MKLTKKARYVASGFLFAIIAIPLGIKAVETIPLSFKEGDVISADLMNSLFSRLNDVQRGYSSSNEIEGTWSCTTYSVRDGCDAEFLPTVGGVLKARSQNIAFSCAAGICTATAESFYPGSCNGGGTRSQQYKLRGNVMASAWGITAIQKLSATEFVWQINSSLPQQEYVACVKLNIAPAPVDQLSASVAGAGVTLTWIDQSSDETGFKVQRKNSAGGSWATIRTTAANVTSYADTNLAIGGYSYKVIAVNSYGDSIGSSEVRAVIQ